MINFVLLFHVFFILAFDYLPDGVQTILAATVAFLYVAVVAQAWGMGRNRDLAPLTIPMLGILSSWAIATINWTLNSSPHPPLFSDAARQIAMIAAFFAFMATRDQIQARTLKVSLALVLISAALHALLLPKELLNFTYRLAPFTGGLHTSGYLMLASLLLVVGLRAGNDIGRPTALFAGLILVVLIWGNGVRTPIVFLLTYFATTLALQISPSPISRTLWAIEAGLIVFAGSIWLVSVDLSVFETLSSGRLQNYAERFQILAARPLGELLFGSGPGTDVIRTTVWWWDEKDSHSDLLKYIWESGMLGFLAIVAWLLQVAWYRRGELLPLVVGIVASSAISNAYLTRPNAAFLLFAAVAYGVAARETRIGAQTGQDPSAARLTDPRLGDTLQLNSTIS